LSRQFGRPPFPFVPIFQQPFSFVKMALEDPPPPVFSSAFERPTPSVLLQGSLCYPRLSYLSPFPFPFRWQVLFCPPPVILNLFPEKLWLFPFRSFLPYTVILSGEVQSHFEPYRAKDFMTAVLLLPPCCGRSPPARHAPG